MTECYHVRDATEAVAMYDVGKGGGPSIEEKTLLWMHLRKVADGADGHGSRRAFGVPRSGVFICMGCGGGHDVV